MTSRIRKTTSQLFMIATLAVVTSSSSCRQETADSPANDVKVELKKHSYSEPHLGTMVHLVFYMQSEEEATQLSRKCFRRVKTLNTILSDYQADSEVSILCANEIGTAHKVSDELIAVISQAQKIFTSKATQHIKK